MRATHHSATPVKVPACSRAPRLGTQEYALYALANRRVSIRPRVMRSGPLAGAVFWEIEYLGAGGGAMWARFAPTLADAMNVVYATRHARERADSLARRTTREQRNQA